jgi:hypothetical protein
MTSEHLAGGHAELAPSAAERWIQCPASVRTARNIPVPPSSSYAAEGTAAHALCELVARHNLLTPMSRSKYAKAVTSWRKEHGAAITDEAEMFNHALAYVDLLRAKLAEHPNSHLLLEQRVPTGVPSCWGTADAVIVSPVHVEIIDVKYGKGVLVEAEGNAQLRLYGVGGLEAFGDVLGEAEKVTMTVWQPRLNHTASEVLTAVELRAWRDSLIPVAEAALGHDAPFGPSETACRWCPAAGQCAAQMTWATTLDFGVTAEVLDDEALADALERIPAIEAWCKAVKDYALDRAYSQRQPIPGFKVVLSGGRRVITHPDAAIEALKLVGYTLDQIASTKIKGIGELEKLLKGDFDTVLSAWVTKTEGSPALVPEADKRAPIDPDTSAAAVFGDA